MILMLKRDLPSFVAFWFSINVFLLYFSNQVESDILLPVKNFTTYHNTSYVLLNSSLVSCSKGIYTGSKENSPNLKNLALHRSHFCSLLSTFVGVLIPPPSSEKWFHLILQIWKFQNIHIYQPSHYSNINSTVDNAILQNDFLFSYHLLL